MNHDDIDDLLAHGLRDYNAPPAVPRDELWQRIAEARTKARATEDATSAAPSVRSIDGRRARAWWTWTTAGIAASLLVAAGIGIGRWMERHPRATPVLASTPNASAVNASASNALTPATVVPETTASDTSGGRAAVGPAPSQQVASATTPRNAEPGRASAPRGRATTDNLAYRLVVLQHLAGSEAMITAFRSSARTGHVDPQITRWSRELLSTTRLLEASQATDDPVMKRLLGDLDLIITQIVQYSAHDTVNTEELDLIEQSINQRGVITKLRGTLPGRTAPVGS